MTQVYSVEQRHLMSRWFLHKWLLFGWLSFTKGLYGFICRSLIVATLITELKYELFLKGAKIQQQLAKIHNNVKKLQHQLKDVKPTPDCKKSSI